MADGPDCEGMVRRSLSISSSLMSIASSSQALMQPSVAEPNAVMYLARRYSIVEWSSSSIAVQMALRKDRCSL